MNLIECIYIIEAHKYVAAIVYYALFLTSVIVLLHLFGTTPLALMQLAKSASPVGVASADYLSDRPKGDIHLAQPVPLPGAVWPLHGMVTTQFGASDLPYQRVHTGIDISSGQSSGVRDIVAFKSGTVFTPARPLSGYGNVVAIDHGSGVTSYYGHLATITVHPGQQVNVGDVIGKEGSTGNSTGPHVHFEVRLNDAPVNPHNYLDGNP